MHFLFTPQERTASRMTLNYLPTPLFVLDKVGLSWNEKLEYFLHYRIQYIMLSKCFQMTTDHRPSN